MEHTVNQRLKMSRKLLDLTAAEVSVITGLTTSQIYNIENGKSAASVAFLNTYSNHYGISLSWLMTGEGEMSSTAQELPSMAKSQSLSTLPEWARKTIAELTNTVSQQMEIIANLSKPLGVRELTRYLTT